MVPAETRDSTPPTNTSAPTPQSSRRGFLVQAAGVAVGGAALGAGLPLPAPTAATAQSRAGKLPDPIFAAIEAHRRAVATHDEAVDLETALEASLPDDQRQSTTWKETIVETDDPRWLAAMRAVSAASNATDDLAINLLNTEPTTVAGIEALLRYFADDEDNSFPDGVARDDGSEETFGTYLARHAADALRKIARANCQMAQGRDEVQS
jgi:hypothetical protein